MKKLLICILIQLSLTQPSFSSDLECTKAIEYEILNLTSKNKVIRKNTDLLMVQHKISTFDNKLIHFLKLRTSLLEEIISFYPGPRSDGLRNFYLQDQRSKSYNLENIESNYMEQKIIIAMQKRVLILENLYRIKSNNKNLCIAANKALSYMWTN